MSLTLICPTLPALPGQISSVEAATKINKKSVTLIKGQKVTLKITGTKKKVKWSSSKKSVATVSTKGKVTAKKKGTAKITAKVGTKKYTCKVKVETPSINKTNATLKIGNTLTLKLNGTSQKVTWKSHDSSVATVNSKGKVTAIKEGTVKITAKIGSKKYNCQLTVTQDESKTFDKKAAENNISKKIIEANGCVYVFLDSIYSVPTDVSAKCTFYDVNGNAVDYKNDSIGYLEKGHCGVLEFYLSSVEYSSYDITYEFTEGLKYFYHKSVIDKLSVASNFVEHEYGDYIMLAVKNENDYDCYICEVAVIYYDNYDNVVGVSLESIDIDANSEETRKSYIPYDKKTYNDIEYSRYETFISYGYHLGK